jgi:hypothetical protein
MYTHSIIRRVRVELQQHRVGGYMYSHSSIRRVRVELQQQQIVNVGLHRHQVGICRATADSDV